MYFRHCYSITYSFQTKLIYYTVKGITVEGVISAHRALRLDNKA